MHGSVIQKSCKFIGEKQWEPFGRWCKISKLKEMLKWEKWKIYFSLQGTTLILWFPLILMSVVEVVFSCRCFLACTSFLRLRCPWRRNVRVNRTTCNDYVYFLKDIFVFARQHEHSVKGLLTFELSAFKIQIWIWVENILGQDYVLRVILHASSLLRLINLLCSLNAM